MYLSCPDEISLIQFTFICRKSLVQLLSLVLQRRNNLSNYLRLSNWSTTHLTIPQKSIMMLNKLQNVFKRHNFLCIFNIAEFLLLICSIYIYKYIWYKKYKSRVFHKCNQYTIEYCFQHFYYHVCIVYIADANLLYCKCYRNLFHHEFLS